MNRHKHYVQITKSSNGTIPIIFLGDSITEGWSFNGWAIYKSKYTPLGVVNYGISADRTEHVLWRIQNGEIQGLSPKLIVLMIGVNNLGYYKDKDIAFGIITIVEYLRNVLSNTKILLLGILPRNGGNAWTRIIEINRNIAKLNDNENIHFLDMFNNFTSDQWGIVNNNLFYDGLHLTSAGYQMWADLMDPLFNDIIKGKE